MKIIDSLEQYNVSVEGERYLKVHLCEDDPILKALTVTAESMSKLIFSMSQQLDYMEDEIIRLHNKVK